MPDTLVTLVIGYGNALRGDDGAGYIAAELLSESIHNPAVEVLSVHQLTPELMERISRARQVIFLDAAIIGRADRYQRVPLRPAPSCSRFTHQVTPETLLAGAQALYGHTPEAVLYSIPGKFFEIGQELTPSVRRAVEALVAELAALLDARIARGGGT
jgi:hydrogenase maturation protease